MAYHTLMLKDAIDLAPNGDIGLNDYPIFDEKYRETLNQKIINRYWNQEIGQETISMFSFALRRRMHEIMPLYNEHYKLSKLEVDPLNTVDIESITQSTATADTESTSTSESGTNSTSRAVVSETPQNALQADADYATGLQDNTAATNGTALGSEANKTSQEASNSNTMKGYQGHGPALILAARQAIVNVDLMIINELQDLFMLVWSTQESHTQKASRYYGYF